MYSRQKELHVLRQEGVNLPRNCPLSCGDILGILALTASSSIPFRTICGLLQVFELKASLLLGRCFTT
jgi:hypothetical protein